MTASLTTADGIPSWLAQEYCASVAAALLARNEYFELLEDAMHLHQESWIRQPDWARDRSITTNGRMRP